MRRVPSAWIAAFLALGACSGPSRNVRATVPPTPVAVVNDNAFTYTAHLAVGLEPSGDFTLDPHSCVLLSPPTSRQGELRVQVRDADQNLVVDLYGRRLLDAWSGCTCSAGSFRHCVRIPAPPEARANRP